MKLILVPISAILALIFQVLPVNANINVAPAAILQGDPAEITVSGTTSSGIKSLTFNGKPLKVFDYNGKATALVGIDLNMKDGKYPVVAILKNGKKVSGTLTVGKRQIAEAPLGIPESLGGNTAAGQQNLLANLAADNATLQSLQSSTQTLWSGKFIFPVSNPVVTDVYGYTRLTVKTTISHKGTDFRAPIGTPVYAMNSGRVVLSKFLTSYGNAIVIDHGNGLQTLYLHLSESDVKVGDMIKQGQLIGKSGDTGYAEGPHLHISVRIGGISIDPMKFMELLGSGSIEP